MKGFKTLFWLEYRRSGAWAIALIGSLAFWAWGLFQVRRIELAEQLGIRGMLVAMAAVVGAVVLALMIGRLRGETRGGQYQVLLLSPPSGHAHIAARYTFALATAILYYVMIGGLACWTLWMSAVPLDAGSIAQLTLAIPLYVLGVTVLPLLAWTLLLMVFTSAYRVSGPGWVPGTVSYTLPGWRLLEGVQMAVLQTTVEAQLEPVATLPQEPLWIMLALTLVLLVIASRIWREVEA
ncbi:MAG: hypothetical protein NTX69_07020 [Candidatus Bipolaricaulota bacterium]|nr:hypothetical protein [Candidatus Bipolaricaulota bacterium]